MVLLGPAGARERAEDAGCVRSGIDSGIYGETSERRCQAAGQVSGTAAGVGGT